MSGADILTILSDYSAGRRGTRETIASLGLDDYADLVIALAQNGLRLPPPSSHPTVVEDRERAWSLLKDRLARGA